MSPMEQAFALIGFAGGCGAARTVEAGVHQAMHTDSDQVDAWISIGDCLNRIASERTVH